MRKQSQQTNSKGFGKGKGNRKKQQQQQQQGSSSNGAEDLTAMTSLRQALRQSQEDLENLQVGMASHQVVTATVVTPNKLMS